MNPQTFNPGSREARKAGCRCPVLSNAHGKGYHGIPGSFVLDARCPLHGTQARRAKERKPTAPR